jgi:tRNA A-37 threonylcarbamoyl transferase component Bud32
MPGLTCISDPELRAFLLGELPERVGRAVAAHLETCPNCEAAARRLDALTDPVIDRLRQALDPGAAGAVTRAPDGTPEDSTAPPPAPAAPPRRVAGYEVLEEVGRGGMSVVYRARQAHPARLVALKVLLVGGHADAERRARFLAEADAIARLQHPHIVQIHEVGEHDGLPFLALEYVAGGSLAQQLGGGPLLPRAAAALLELLARAVDFAHEHGVVHRDLKPANVLFAPDGTPKITDFGLAKHQRPDLTATGVVLGTPGYMAPEQAAGKGKQVVGPPADVYALGAILYECLTGRPPFLVATSLDTLAQVLTEEPVPPRRLNAQVPRDLETVCLKCLQKDPRHRYASAQDLADDLGRWLRGEPVRARPIGLPGQAWRWCRRRPAVALLTASVASLLVAVAAIAALATWRLREEANRARAAEREANERLVQSYLDQARASRQSGRMGQRFGSLEALAKAAELARSLGLDAGRIRELRNEAVSCLALTDLRVRQQWPAEDNPFWDFLVVQLGSPVAFDATLQQFACADAQGIVRVRQVGSDRDVARLPAPTPFTGCIYPSFSPDAHFLAVNYCLPDQTVDCLVWDLAGGRAVRRFAPAEGVFLLGFSPDSRYLVTSRVDTSVGLLDLAGGSERLLKLGQRMDRVAFRPDGRRMACSCRFTHEVRIVDLDTGEIVKSLAPRAELWALAWSPDGRLLAGGVTTATCTSGTRPTGISRP